MHRDCIDRTDTRTKYYRAGKDEEVILVIPRAFGSTFYVCFNLFAARFILLRYSRLLIMAAELTARMFRTSLPGLILLHAFSDFALSSDSLFLL